MVAIKILMNRKSKKFISCLYTKGCKSRLLAEYKADIPIILTVIIKISKDKGILDNFEKNICILSIILKIFD